MIKHELIERIEGEAALDFRIARDGRVKEVNIRFPHFRGMEAILEGRHPLDALVIAPRVCGICGHSHLNAAVRAIESAYANSALPLLLSDKAQKIRQLTLQCELLQNHLKWLYLIIVPESEKLLGGEGGLPLKALYAASEANRLAALFSGQWPHSSYALPGGVSCDPTHLEVMQGEKILSEIERFVEAEVLGTSLERYEAIRDSETLFSLEGDFGVLARNVEKLGLSETGRSHGRFLVLGEGGERGILTPKGRETPDAENVKEEPAHTPFGKSYAKNALYGGEFYETGPLARALCGGRGIVEALRRERGEGTLTRIAARVDEIVLLLRTIRVLIEGLDLGEPSFIPPSPIENISGEGIGIVEAPRGSLIHRAAFDKGKITSYTIITPTQWNLGNGTPDRPGIAQKAMIGSESREKASFLFRTFDVCSVCTTH